MNRATVHALSRPALAAVLLIGLNAWAGPAATSAAPASFVAQPVAAGAPGAAQRSFDGVVEAVRQTVVAAQVAGAVVEIAVQPGQVVKAGQLLVRLDARAAEQNAAASAAQVQAANAALALARSDLDRQRQLRAQGFISASALDRAEADFRATEARQRAQIAQAEAARTDTSFYLLRAPYDGVVAEVPVMPGEMALPGRALVQLFDPTRLRVSAPLPQGASLPPEAGQVRIEITGAGARELTPSSVQILPLADASTQTALLRAELPREAAAGLMPGRCARVWLPAAAGATAGPLRVPTKSVVRRGDLAGLYVLDAQNRPLLRQVRLAAPRGDSVEVLAGLHAGERVVADPSQLNLGGAR
jgi:RND family efflux transporter MFP subunit